MLSVLAGTTSALTGRAVARRVPHASPGGVARVLDVLVRGGLVTRTDAGSAALYRLNREHLAAPAVEQLAGMRLELVRRLREFCASTPAKPLSAYLYGSAARGDGDEDSDIDVLLVWPYEYGPGSVGEPTDGVLGDLAHSIQLWTGNTPSIIEYSMEELRELAPGEAKAFVDQIRDSGGGIHLYGATLEALCFPGRRS